MTGLSAPARLVALLAAVETDLEVVLHAAERLAAGAAAGSGAAASVVAAAFAELEESGLAEVSGTGVRFRHPLMRSAIHEAAAPAEVRHVHAVLAELTAGDRRAWHLAGAALGQAEPVAVALAEAAERARDRGGYGAAATALTRAPS